MAEIENKWALRESGKNWVDRTVQRRSAGKQGQRIEIALNRPPLLDHRPRKLKLDRPIKPDRIDCNRVEIATELSAGAVAAAVALPDDRVDQIGAAENSTTKPKCSHRRDPVHYNPKATASAPQLLRQPN